MKVGAPSNRRITRIALKKHIPVYLIFLLPIIHVIIFHYLPMYGVVIAFKDFKVRRGILGSDWVGLKHFIKMFSDKTFYRVLGNTLRLSTVNVLVCFPVVIGFALMVNEIHAPRFKRVSQTITYLPYFISWVVMGALVKQVLSPSTGVVNILMRDMGMLDQPIYFLIEPKHFDWIFHVSGIWKGLGWSIIIYLAAISGIDPTLYEAASIDGAGRLRKAISITLPCIMPTACTLLILDMGGLMNVGFEKVYNLYTDGTMPVADVISTYVYRRGLIDTKYDYTTAVGLFQNVVSIVLVLLANWLARKASPDFRIM